MKEHSSHNQARMVELDVGGPHGLSVFCLEDEDGNIGFNEEELHNVRIWINGYPVVLVVGEPDEYTKQLLGLQNEHEGGDQHEQNRNAD